MWKLHPKRDTLQPLPTYTVHKGWGETDRARKIRLTGPLARPKKGASPTKHSGPLTRRRDMPIKALRPFYPKHASLLVPAQNEGPTRLAQRPIIGSLSKIKKIEYNILQIQPNLINKERKVMTVHHQTLSPNKERRLSQINCSFYILYQIRYR